MTIAQRPQAKGLAIFMEDLWFSYAFAFHQAAHVCLLSTSAVVEALKMMQT